MNFSSYYSIIFFNLQSRFSNFSYKIYFYKIQCFVLLRIEIRAIGHNKSGRTIIFLYERMDFHYARQTFSYSDDHWRFELGQHRSFPIWPRRMDLRRTGCPAQPHRLHGRRTCGNLVHFPSLPRKRSGGYRRRDPISTVKKNLPVTRFICETGFSSK